MPVARVSAFARAMGVGIALAITVPTLPAHSDPGATPTGEPSATTAPSATGTTAAQPSQTADPGDTGTTGQPAPTESQEAPSPDPTQAEPSPPASSRPEPSGPQPSEPEPSQPEPRQPEPSKPEPSEPQPSQPQPSQPEPSQPQPSGSQPSQPQPSGREPTPPQPSQPAGSGSPSTSPVPDPPRATRPSAPGPSTPGNRPPETSDPGYRKPPPDPAADLYPHPPFAPATGNPSAALLQQLYDAQTRQRSLRNQITTTEAELTTAERAVQEAKTKLHDARGTQPADIVDLCADQMAGAVDSRDALRANLTGLRQSLQRADTKVRALQQRTAMTLAPPTGRTGVPAGPADGALEWPVAGTVTSEYGNRHDPYYRAWQLHAGIDIAAATGTRVRAAATGTVVQAGWYGGYGNYICLGHGQARGEAMTTCYGHLSQILVTEGQAVRAGQAIGEVGSTGASTGPHLHFEVRLGGRPTDPRLWL